MPVPVTQHCTWSSCHWNKERKEKSVQIRREEIKLFLFEDDLVVYIENPKESTDGDVS